MANRDIKAVLAELEGGFPPTRSIRELSAQIPEGNPNEPLGFILALIENADPVFLEAVRFGQQVVRNADLDHGNVQTLVEKAHEVFHREHYDEDINYGGAWSRLNIAKVLGWTVGVACELEHMMQGAEAIDGYTVS